MFLLIYFLKIYKGGLTVLLSLNQTNILFCFSNEFWWGGTSPDVTWAIIRYFCISVSLVLNWKLFHLNVGVLRILKECKIQLAKIKRDWWIRIVAHKDIVYYKLFFVHPSECFQRLLYLSNSALFLECFWCVQQ